ncbi:MAG: DUF4261 domain-containing protein [Pelagimonas sp.]|jgi:hypothetical protein|nr:DUF4261 domain-containing protein [Pelagimonas sp.]
MQVKSDAKRHQFSLENWLTTGNKLQCGYNCVEKCDVGYQGVANMNATFMAVVLLRNSVSLDASGLASALSQCPDEMDPKLVDVSDDGRLAKLSVLGIPFAVQTFDEPAPTENFTHELRGQSEGPLFDAVDGHRAQLSVMCHLTETQMAQSVIAAAAVHMLAAHLGPLGEPLAGYWVASERLSPWDRFSADAQGVTTTLLDNDLTAIPSRYWTGVQLTQENDNIGGYTRGLRPFTGYELALTPVAQSMQFVAQRLVATAQYLFENGPVLHDGQTLGGSEDERFAITLDQHRAEMHLTLQTPRSEAEYT